MEASVPPARTVPGTRAPTAKEAQGGIEAGDRPGARARVGPRENPRKTGSPSWDVMKKGGAV